MKPKLESLIDKAKVPNHVVIIMDGNGRWAKGRGIDRIGGHFEGMKSVKAAVKAAMSLGVKHLTLYAFSAQNWHRPKDEVNALMELLREYLTKECANLIKKGIRLKAIGRLSELPQDSRLALFNAMERTKRCSEMTLTLALSYGGREEIVDAVRKILSSGLSAEGLSEEKFSEFLYTADLPEPDFLIRTSGEMRLSNFLLWQLAYAEIYVTNTLWPDFRRRHFLRAILDYQKRERRFGLTSEQLIKREAS
ncbi:MAG: isoprenyl transferase [Deltaproteobacteria bacterium]